MKHRSVRVLGVGISCLLVIAQSRAQQPLATVGRFDLAVTRLPTNYTGDRIEQLIDALTPSPKTEFETAAQYAARAPKLEGGSLYAFVLDAPNLQIDYVPERELYVVVINEDQGVVYDYARRLGSRAITIKRSDMANGAYVGGNAFGATRTIQRYTTDIYSIVHDRPGREATLTERTHRIEVPMPRERAQQLKGRIRVLLVCHGYVGPQPQVFEGKELSTPTISSPSEIQMRYHYLQVGDVTAVWIFDASTGEILAR